jgi:hypothetical protein
VRVQIKLPKVFSIVVRADGWPIMDDEIPRIRGVDGDVKKANVGGVAKLTIGNKVKHGI